MNSRVKAKMPLSKTLRLTPISKRLLLVTLKRFKLTTMQVDLWLKPIVKLFLKILLCVTFTLRLPLPAASAFLSVALKVQKLLLKTLLSKIVALSVTVIPARL